MPLNKFAIPTGEPTSVKFWQDLNTIVDFINQLDIRLTELEAREAKVEAKVGG